MRMIKNNGNKAHIQFSGKYYVISDNGEETLIFPSDSKGNITSYVEVGGCEGKSLTEVLANFDSFLYTF